MSLGKCSNIKYDRAPGIHIMKGRYAARQVGLVNKVQQQIVRPSDIPISGGLTTLMPAPVKNSGYVYV